MKQLYKLPQLYLGIIYMLGVHFHAFAQTYDDPVALGSTSGFLKSIQVDMAASRTTDGKSFIQQRVAKDQELKLKVNYDKPSTGDDVYMAGSIEGYPNSDFLIKTDEGKLDGNIVLKNQKKAYKYYSDDAGNAYIKEVDINAVLCVEYTKVKGESDGDVAKTTAEAQPDLQSLPGATAVIYLDFDGEYVSGTPWNGGNPINAVSRGYSNAEIAEIWERVAQDFYAFNINVTTNRGVFDAAPQNRRMMAIFTTTNTAAPGSGGVAYLGSFRWSDNTPCWVFNGGIQTAATTASHEVGHTLDLGHDGRTSPSEGYYNGHGNWGPIMGAAFGKSLDQWSKGEYANANNTQDDIAIITSSQNGFGFKADDHGNGTGGATPLQVNSSGTIGNNNGIIERENDLDVFSFTTGGGAVSINVSPRSNWTNLDVQAQILNSSGGVVATSSDPGLSAQLNVSLGAGTYYIRVDGIGTGNPTTGYSDYASIGDYSISGNIPPGVVSDPNGVVTFYKDCSFGGTAVTLGEGDYTLADLQARGIANDDVSSIRVRPGFKVRLFWDDNYNGSDLLVTSDNSCLVDEGWNDQVSSLRIRANGNTSLTGTYLLKNVGSGLVMDVANWGTQDGANILQWHSHGGTNQQFQLTHLRDGIYVLANVNSGKVMDVDGISKNSGANIHQWTNVGGDNQKFIIQNAPNGVGYKIIAFHSQHYVKVIPGNPNSPGANIIQGNNGSNNESSWTLEDVSTPPFSNLIQAEDYTNMAGIQTEATTDAGGGLNVGWIDAGDWMAFTGINFPESGNYKVEYRVASLNGGGQVSLDLNAGAIQLGVLNVPSTGGWQNWTTISHTVSVNAGTYALGVFAPAGGWNINWIRITKTSGAATAQTADAAPKLKKLDTYPNPAEGAINIADPDGSLAGGQMVIVNGQGNVVYEGTFTSRVDLSDFAIGMYTVKVIAVDGSVSSNLFIKN